MSLCVNVMGLHQEFLNSPIAHRGLHDCNGSFGTGRTENSLSAVQAAIQEGYCVEVDLQFSQDGVPIVFHDTDLERLLGRSERIRDLSSRQLMSLKLPNHDKIPTLSCLLDLVSGKVPLVLEVKDQDGLLGPNITELDNSLVRILKNYDGLVAIMSFNPYIVKSLAYSLPNIPRGLITESFRSSCWPKIGYEHRKKLQTFQFLEVQKMSFISHDFLDLKNNLMLEASKGLKKFCWTVRSKAEAEEALKTVDNITFEGFYPKKTYFGD